MPENRTFITIPPLALSAGSGNETDISSAGRSSSRNNTARNRRSVGGFKNWKIRVSNGLSVAKQNDTMKNCVSHKSTSVRAKIPRALLSTPKTGKSESKFITLTNITAKESLTYKLLEQNSNTKAVVNFHVKRSISAMDLKHARRTGNFPPMTTIGTEIINAIQENSQNSSHPTTATSSKISSLCSSDFLCKAFNHEGMIAEMKIGNSLILNAWRKKRSDVKNLVTELNGLRQKNRNIKAQLYIMNSLYDQERLRNQDLVMKAKKVHEDLSNTKRSCESLTTSLISLKSEKSLLENQICLKEQECEGVNTVLTQTKSELFKSMSRERELQSQLSELQRRVQSLESIKLDLHKEIGDINTEALEREFKYRELLEERQNQLDEVIVEKEILEDQVYKLKEKECLLEECMKMNDNLKEQLNQFQIQVDTLQHCLGTTLGNRIKACWNISLAYQKTTMQVFHWFAYHMLPGTPPPKMTRFPFTMALEKALRIVNQRAN